MKNQVQQSQQKKEKKEKTPEEKTIETLFSLATPEAILMFLFAGLLDGIGYLLLIIGLDDFWITDIIGAIIIGLWMLSRGSSPLKLKKSSRLKRWGISTLVEAVPYLGDIMPSWILVVYFELKNNPR